MIVIEQIKAARALLDWTQDDLAQRAGLSKPAINTLERRIANPRADTMAAIRRALEDGGVEFTEGTGVKLRSTLLKTTLLEGEDALIRLYSDIFDTLSRTNGELLISGVIEENYRFLGGARVIEEIERCHRHGIRTRLLSCEGERNFIEPLDHYRWMPQAFFPEMPTYIYDNKHALLLVGPPVKIALIESAEIAESHRRQFNAHWTAATPPVL